MSRFSHKLAWAAALVIGVVMVLGRTRDASVYSLRSPIRLASNISNSSPFPTSFWFVKTHKVGGSTLAAKPRGMATRSGVACLRPKPSGWESVDEIRAAATIAHKRGFEHTAIVDHGAFMPEAGPLLTTAPQRQPLLFSAVRHPVPRVISGYFFNDAKGENRHLVPSEEEQVRCVAALHDGRPCDMDKMLAAFEQTSWSGDGLKGRNHLFKYMSGGKTTPKEALEQFDFVFVTERFDESLVIWALKYSVPLRDVVYYEKARDRSGAYPGPEYMPKTFLDRIHRDNALDEELWNLAYVRLDDERKRLEEAGHDVKGALETFAALQALVHEKRQAAEGVVAPSSRSDD